METRSFVIPASEISTVEAKITKLNKRGAKLGLAEITWTIGKAFTKTYDVLANPGGYSGLAPQWIKRDMLAVPFEISGPISVSYDGWTFIATLQHLPTGETIVRAISDEVKVPTYYRDTGSVCEHCNVNRYRKDTYVLSHEDERVIQVGSTCIKDFLGGNSPDDILNKANFISDLISYLDGMEGGGGGSGVEVFAIEAVLAQTSACIRDHGWLSKSKANETDAKATASWVHDNLSPPMDRKIVFSAVTEDDSKRAKLAVEWVESITDAEVEENDYLYNIRAIARSGMVERRTLGFAASIVPAFERATEVKEPKKPSKHIGEIKKRSTFLLVLKRHFVYDGDYGSSHRYIFEDQDGNVLVWKASSAHDMVEGHLYNVKGTVKAHTEYKNVPQTEITRCQVITDS